MLTARQMVRACRCDLETNYGACSVASGLFTFDFKGLVAPRDLVVGRERLLATTGRVHELLQSDHRERATCPAKMPCKWIDVLSRMVCDRVHSAGANCDSQQR